MSDETKQQDLFNNNNNRSKRLRTVLSKVLIDNSACCLDDSKDRLTVCNGLVKDVLKFVQDEIDDLPIIGDENFVPTREIEAHFHNEAISREAG